MSKTPLTPRSIAVAFMLAGLSSSLWIDDVAANVAPEARPAKRPSVDRDTKANVQQAMVAAARQHGHELIACVISIPDTSKSLCATVGQLSRFNPARAPAIAKEVIQEAKVFGETAGFQRSEAAAWDRISSELLSFRGCFGGTDDELHAVVLAGPKVAATKGAVIDAFTSLQMDQFDKLFKEGHEDPASALSQCPPMGDSSASGAAASHDDKSYDAVVGALGTTSAVHSTTMFLERMLARAPKRCRSGGRNPTDGGKGTPAPKPEKADPEEKATQELSEAAAAVRAKRKAARKALLEKRKAEQEAKEAKKTNPRKAKKARERATTAKTNHDRAVQDVKKARRALAKARRKFEVVRTLGSLPLEPMKDLEMGGAMSCMAGQACGSCRGGLTQKGKNAAMEHFLRMMSIKLCKLDTTTPNPQAPSGGECAILNRSDMPTNEKACRLAQSLYRGPGRTKRGGKGGCKMTKQQKMQSKFERDVCSRRDTMCLPDHATAPPKGGTRPPKPTERPTTRGGRRPG